MDLQTVALLEHSGQRVVLVGVVWGWTGLEEEVVVGGGVEHGHGVGVAAALQKAAIQTAQLVMRGYVQLLLLLLLELFIIVILLAFLLVLLAPLAHIQILLLIVVIRDGSFLPVRLEYIQFAPHLQGESSLHGVDQQIAFDQNQSPEFGLVILEEKAATF